MGVGLLQLSSSGERRQQKEVVLREKTSNSVRRFRAALAFRQTTATLSFNVYSSLPFSLTADQEPTVLTIFIAFA